MTRRRRRRVGLANRIDLSPFESRSRLPNKPPTAIKIQGLKHIFVTSMRI